MSDLLLDVRNISVSIDSKKVLRDVNLQIKKGETHVLMGPNGAGKSTLGNAIMGNPLYAIDGGHIFFNGQDLMAESADKRAKAGIFLSFQNPLEVPGISLEAFIRSAIQQRSGERVKLFQFQKELKNRMELLNMDTSCASRDLNVGFSGGERKKAEILQLLMLHPELAILDETDSGLDVDAVQIVSEGVAKFHTVENSCLIITHNARILDKLKVDYVHVVAQGKIVREGGAELIQQINKEGFANILAAQDQVG